MNFCLIENFLFLCTLSFDHFYLIISKVFLCWFNFQKMFSIQMNFYDNFPIIIFENNWIKKSFARNAQAQAQQTFFEWYVAIEEWDFFLFIIIIDHHELCFSHILDFTNISIYEINLLWAIVGTPQHTVLCGSTLCFSIFLSFANITLFWMQWGNPK